MANQFPPQQHQHYRLDVAEYLLIHDALLIPGVLITPLVVHRLENLNRHLSYMYLNRQIPVQTGDNPDPIQHSKSYKVSLIIK
jgi:hypothetical protein